VKGEKYDFEELRVEADEIDQILKKNYTANFKVYFQLNMLFA